MNKNKSREIILSVLGIAILIIAVVGVSFAMFNYLQKGQTINKINVAKMTFLYTEDDVLGNGITLSDALPITDLEGIGSLEYFDFTITADAAKAPITYDIVLSEAEISTLDKEIIKIYLTKLENEKEIAILNPKKYQDLDDYLINEEQNKLLLNIPLVDSDNYTQQYRLRMWIDEDATLYQEEDGIIIKDNINKTFAIKVNVRAKNINHK
ncbi:MAG: hypothetical protein GX861_02485 [Tenericutes bacterium]|jgi:hypothetical protein|nr:hypothetical protein [Mycoplasmatota bacterium]